MHRASFAVVLTLSAVACDPLWQSHWIRLESPDEAAWFSIDCSGGIGNCYRRAPKLCLYGYTVQDRGAGPAVAQTFGTTTLVSHRDELIIRCRPIP